MAKTKELAVPASDERPSFLAVADGQKPMGHDDLKAFVRPPRLKVVQKMSKPPFTDNNVEGDLILVPQLITVAPIDRDEQNRPGKQGRPFFFVPVFFFPEWISWNPLKLKGSEPAIRERSFDPRSDIARKSRDPQLRSEKMPGTSDDELKIKHQEHLNFVIMLLSDDPTGGMPIVMSFAKTAHKHGSNLCSLIAMRKADVFACVFQGQVKMESNAKGDFYNIFPTNPDTKLGQAPWIQDEAVYARLRASHEEFAELHKASRIVVDHDDEDVDEVPKDSF
jgi:hypothetical protein